MTHLPAPTWKVIAREPGPRGFWRSLIQDQDEAKAVQCYKDTILHWPSEGGVRLLKPDGTVARYAGALGKPGGEE